MRQASGSGAMARVIGFLLVLYTALRLGTATRGPNSSAWAFRPVTTAPLTCNGRVLHVLLTIDHEGAGDEVDDQDSPWHPHL